MLTIAAIIGYTAFLAHYVSGIAAGSDSSGYFNHARALGTGRLHAPLRKLERLEAKDTRLYTYVPLGFVPTKNEDSMVPTYPVGLSIMLLAGSYVVGWEHTGEFVLCLHALAGVLLTYALGRAMGLSPQWSATGGVILGFSPVYLYMAFQTMSDVPALVWVTAAVVAAWRAGTETSAGRQRLWGLLAGATLAMAVLVRPNNALAFVPVVVAIGWSLRGWIYLVLGGLPGGVFFCLHNMSIYGDPFTTGYGSPWGLFSTGYLETSLLHYLLWLPILFTPACLFVPLLPWAGREIGGRQTALLGLWSLTFLVFYALYFFTHETWWYLRFLLPAAPALIVGGLLAARQFAVRWTSRNPRRAWRIALGVALVNSTVWILLLGVLQVGPRQQIYVKIADWLKEHLPSNAVLATMQMSGATYYYTDFTIIRYDTMEPDDFRRVAQAAQAEKRPVYAVLYPFEIDKEKAFQRRIPFQWQQVGAVNKVTIWRLVQDE